MPQQMLYRDSPAADSQKLSSSKLGFEFKYGIGHLCGNDRGSCARHDLNFYDHREDGWLMLGHAVQPEVMIVREGPAVRRAESWECCWTDAGSGRSSDYAIFIPKCSDPSYVACGVVFVFDQKFAEPAQGAPFGLLHKSLAEAVPLVDTIWSDVGVHGHHNVVLKCVPGMGTAWPALATLVGLPPRAHRIRQSLVCNYNLSCAVSPLRVSLRNTFIDAPPELGLEKGSLTVHRGRAHSWPPNPGTGEKACIALAESLEGATWLPVRQSCQANEVVELRFARNPSGEQGGSTSIPMTDSLEPMASPATRDADTERMCAAECHRSEVDHARGQLASPTGRSPSNAILPMLLQHEVLRLGAACWKLWCWSRTRLPPRLRPIPGFQPCAVAVAVAEPTDPRPSPVAQSTTARKKFPFRPKRVYFRAD